MLLGVVVGLTWVKLVVILSHVENTIVSVMASSSIGSSKCSRSAPVER